MGRRNKKGDPVNGWINLDKPLDLGSTQAVGKIRRLLNAQKVGHAGTLDPLATGILPIALGEATKTIPYMQDALKTYEFTVTWGAQTSTDDLEGEVIERSDNRPTSEEIEALLPDFTGDIEQTPPQFSAIKIDGERAYDIARSGDTADIKPRQVYIESLTLLGTDKDTAQFEMICGKGTYVRSLARDMGQKLGCFGHVSLLRRTAVGAFTTKTSISLAKLEEMSDSAARMEALLPLEASLDDIPAIDLKMDETAKLRSGQVLSFVARPDFERLSKLGLGEKEPQTALALFNGSPVALVENKGPTLKPIRVLNV
jgi:tRNA pseudouridine55 synthase